MENIKALTITLVSLVICCTGVTPAMADQTPSAFGSRANISDHRKVNVRDYRQNKAAHARAPVKRMAVSTKKISNQGNFDEADALFGKRTSIKRNKNQDSKKRKVKTGSSDIVKSPSPGGPVPVPYPNRNSKGQPQ